MAEFSDPRGDAELVAAANQGEEEAFTALYERYRAWVFTLAQRLLRDEHEAADVLQETFFYFFGKFPGFRLECRLKTFLYPVVRHRALDHLEKLKHGGSSLEDLALEPASQQRDEVRERRELADRVHGLPEAQREVLLLRFADGLDLAEIATALDIPLGTVKSRLHTALKELKKNLENE